jgi:hypothetical protein
LATAPGIDHQPFSRSTSAYFHRPHLAGPLGGHELHLKRLGRRRPDTRLFLSVVLRVLILVRWLDLLRHRLEVHPQLSELVVAQDTVARTFLARLWNSRGDIAPTNIRQRPGAELRQQILIDDPFLFFPAPVPLLGEFEIRLGKTRNLSASRCSCLS